MPLSRLVLILCLAAPIAAAQPPTTGFPGFNDYTIAALGSGSTSCTSLALVPGPTTFSVDGSAGFPATIFVFAHLLPCTPPSLMFCQGTSLHLPLSPLPLLVDCSPADAAGDFSFTLTLPPALSFSTQAIIISGGCVIATQAYDCTT